MNNAKINSNIKYVFAKWLALICFMLMSGILVTSIAFKPPFPLILNIFIIMGTLVSAYMVLVIEQKEAALSANNFVKGEKL